MLVYGKQPCVESSDPSYSFCLYRLTRDLSTTTEMEILQLAKRAFETRDVRHTTNYHSPVSRDALLSSNPNKGTPWNLQDNYSICSEVEDLGSLIWNRNAFAWSDRQGSPRVQNGAVSAQHLLERTLNPWSAPAVAGNDV